MKITGLEEHFVTDDVLDAWNKLDPQWQDAAKGASEEGDTGKRLLTLGDERLSWMDKVGLDVQVLSLTAPGLHNLSPAEAVALQTDTNDRLSATIQRRPDRYQGLATLASPAPTHAARELERAVTKLGLNGGMMFGRVRERNIDHRDFWPIFEAAEALRAPLYLHPQTPIPAVRAAYYNGYEPTVETTFATFGIGWYYETGIQLLRLILSGVFDRFPHLQLIIGHWGEVVLFYLEEAEHLGMAAKLKRPLLDYVRTNVFVTPSGSYKQRYLRWTKELIGADRMLFATDYPFLVAEQGSAREFLANAALSDDEKEDIASRTWDRLCAGIRR